MQDGFNPNDPFFGDQWHVNPDSPLHQGWDLNIQGAWEDYSGAGVVVGVVDDPRAAGGRSP